ncbi:TetR/AcrR family transcriptional regulator [Mobilicoccus massiliensis]|uniref:TetR/AcrR family transcriptional regulator n=1 Tax=Mobilicoccus massiliensis TaxID=1522310 RepID=UPI0005909433|nr:TetR family transcriptional regulator C-terminal domain-containing protein [Mobilicoccus massiliensis]
MPKIVDHDQRRAELAEAVWRVVLRVGVEGASVRAVAAEAGWSMGALRYYFSTQDGLLEFAIDRMGQRIFDRVRGYYAGVSDGQAEGFERAVRTLCELLPLDEERHGEVLVWMSFMTRARVSGGYDEARRNGWEGERYLCRLAIADTLSLRLPREIDQHFTDDALELEAAELQVCIDGLSVQAVTYPEHWPADALEAAVRRALAGIRERYERRVRD